MNALIVVVGSINIDLVARCERLPTKGETLTGLSFNTYHGGKGANQAVAAARLGQTVAMIGAVGSDSFGPALIDGLNSAGVDTLHVRREEGASGIAIILTSTSAENSIVVVPGANGAVDAASVARAFQQIGPTRIVLAQLELPLDAVESAARCAGEAKALFMLDPAPMRPLPRSLLQQVDWLTPNASEASALLGQTIGTPTPHQALELADQLLRLGARNVLLKLGKLGVAVATSDGRRHYQPAFNVAAVDTTAAGDAFNGGFAAGFCDDLALEECVRYASAVAALSVTRAGAQPSMPNSKAVSEFLAIHKEEVLSQ